MQYPGRGYLHDFMNLRLPKHIEDSFARHIVIQNYQVIEDMYTLVKQTRKTGIGLSKSVRQSSRHQHITKEDEIPQTWAMSFLPAYVCLVHHEASKIPLSSKARYPVPLSPMSEDVEEEGSLIGHVNDLKYQDYNMLDHIEFPQFQVDQYMTMTMKPATKVEALALQDWIASLQSSGLLNLLQIPHFECNIEINVVMKVLLSCMHGGHLWLDHRVDITIDLIHRITSLSKTGANLATHFVGKDQDKKLAAWLIKKYNLTRGGWGYDAM